MTMTLMIMADPRSVLTERLVEFEVLSHLRPGIGGPGVDRPRSHLRRRRRRVVPLYRSADALGFLVAHDESLDLLSHGVAPAGVEPGSRSLLSLRPGILGRILPPCAADGSIHDLVGVDGGVYAGARPERVRRVVDLEGFGLAPAKVMQAPRRLAAWLDEMREPPLLRRYASLDDVAARLIKNNARLDARRARFLAQHWSRPDGDGGYMLLADPAHKIRGPLLYRVDEVMAVWSQVRAKVLHVEAAGSPTLASIAGEIPLDEFKARFRAFPDWREKIVDDAGHMVHHDQPEQIAALIEAFCA